MRRRVPPLHARRLHEAVLVEIAGEGVSLRAGDWLIVRGTTAVGWALGGNLVEHYEIVPEGDLALPMAVRQRIEKTTGIGSTNSPAALAGAIERLASIQIGTIAIEFTPGQLEEIRHRASKRGHTVEQELRAAVDRVKGEIFHRG